MPKCQNIKALCNGGWPDKKTKNFEFGGGLTPKNMELSAKKKVGSHGKLRKKNTSKMCNFSNRTLFPKRIPKIANKETSETPKCCQQRIIQTKNKHIHVTSPNWHRLTE